MDAVGPVRGKQGPRAPRVNEYPRRAQCGCVDKAGNPRPRVDPNTGDCMFCGHMVGEPPSRPRSMREW